MTTVDGIRRSRLIVNYGKLRLDMKVREVNGKKIPTHHLFLTAGIA